MKERPILMNGDMVRAILEGRKTQTRRIAKFQPIEKGLNFSWTELKPGFYCTDNPASGHVLSARRGDGCWEDKTFPLHCPFGVTGDRLWVREAWKIHSFMEDAPVEFQYQADGAIRDENDTADCTRYEIWYEDTVERATSYLEYIHWPIDDEGMFSWKQGESPLPWRPSIHMPRWASRITLEITDVRVERVQEISEADAISEGVQPIPKVCTEISGQEYKFSFRETWFKVYGVDDWERNPWVWVIQFKVVENARS